MIRRIPAPTEEQLAEAEAEIERKRVEREFEERRQQLEDRRPKGAAKITRPRAFQATTPPLNRGPVDVSQEQSDPQRTEQTPAELVNSAEPPAKKKKSRFDVPKGPDGEPLRNATSVIKALGVLYVEERKKNAVEAFQNLRDSIMMNLDVLLPAMPQIKQMFELLQIGEPECKKSDPNGKGDRIENLTKGLRNFLQGDDE
jgi:hypothetical protein